MSRIDVYGLIAEYRSYIDATPVYADG